MEVWKKFAVKTFKPKIHNNIHDKYSLQRLWHDDIRETILSVMCNIKFSTL